MLCFIPAWKLVCSTHGFLGVDIHMSLGIVDIYDFVRPPLGSHENMDHRSDDWIWPIRDDAFGGIRLFV